MYMLKGTILNCFYEHTMITDSTF